MRICRHAKFFSLFLTFFWLTACAGNETANLNSTNAATAAQNSNAETTARDDVEELGKLIKLPFAPEETTYKENAAIDREPGKKKLTAVLLFSADAADQIVANAEKYHAPAPLDVDAESWFPPELVAKSQETGDESLKGISFSAQDFVQPPYANGRLTRITGTNYFVLELSAAN